MIKTQDNAVIVLMAGLAERLYVSCTCRSSARRVKSIHLPGSCCQTSHANSTHMQPNFSQSLMVSSSHCCCQGIFHTFWLDQRPTEQHTYTSMSATSVRCMLHAFTVFYPALSILDTAQNTHNTNTYTQPQGQSMHSVSECTKTSKVTDLVI